MLITGRPGRADKRCLIEARPAGNRPLSASATSTKTDSAVGEALGKMQRSLTNFFGRKGRSAAEVSTPVSKAEMTVASKTILGMKENAAVKKTAIEKPKSSAHGVQRRRGSTKPGESFGLDSGADLRRRNHRCHIGVAFFERVRTKFLVAPPVIQDIEIRATTKDCVRMVGTEPSHQRPPSEQEDNLSSIWNSSFRNA
jgi:hypothetical protein